MSQEAYETKALAALSTKEFEKAVTYAILSLANALVEKEVPTPTPSPSPTPSVEL